jgi:hypothetical protein
MCLVEMIVLGWGHDFISVNTSVLYVSVEKHIAGWSHGLISVNTFVLICGCGEECGRVGSWLNYSEYRCLDVSRVEANVAGCWHGLVSVNTVVFMCDLWGGMC